MERFKRRLSNVDGLKIIQVIVVSSIVGRGTPEDPVRPILEYFDMKGNRLARNDINLSTIEYEEIK